MKRILNIINPVLLIGAFSNSLSGLGSAIKSERAVQQEIVLLIIGAVAAFLLTDTATERAILVGVLGLVLIVEIVNSAIEATIDRIGPEQHPLSKQAKDLGSAAVLLSLVTAAALWLIILI
ncbi:MAG: diacylglycerol kinase [Chloroflexi bacterium]|jgi:diacylglycerol kinase (ATP)|nr:diacylglycerol kinase [Chloroflexota bacterium]MBT5628084.1 diacylglycerol kinase [Chloroflexota bacterium]